MNFLKYILPLVLAATVEATPISVELTGGSVINGELISWDGQEVQVKAEFGTMKFKKEALSSKTLERLDLQSGDPQKMAAKIAELEATVASLRRDNAALRQQIAQTPARPAPASVGTTSGASGGECLLDGQRRIPAAPVAPTSGVKSQTTGAAAESSGLSYTRSSTGKRHNSNCRYFGSGSPCGPNDGIPCKICGG